MSADFSDICAYLDTIPAASRCWADALYCAKLSMPAIQVFVETMRSDLESPLRLAETGVLSKELMRLNADAGIKVAGEGVTGRPVIRLNAFLTVTEQTSVVRLVQAFCQPEFISNRRFGNNSHMVMNGVRRATSGYIWTKIDGGKSVLEVGPDVSYWSTGFDGSDRAGRGKTTYKGSRPIITPRDSVRVEWGKLVARCNLRKADIPELQKERSTVLMQNMSAVFDPRKVQDVDGQFEYILSQDSNYDINFSDMPVVMARLRTRAWYGVMVRAKGVTSVTKIKEGRLDLMGVTFRVDWAADRIDFRHPQCSAFGYSHKASQYLLYEQHNGYVWNAPDAHYVYSKGPETNAELLFFNVYRVPHVVGMVEPRYVDNPHAGRTFIKSVWAVGDEVSGVPNAFERVAFHVDTLNFSKVLEKRRAIDYKGCLSTTVTLVRSTNVRFWLNGTPLGASERVEANLVEAVAVVVELMAMEGRLDTNLAFDKAMSEFKLSVKDQGVFSRLLGTIMDMRYIAGKVSGCVSRMWEPIRSTLLEQALAPISEMAISVSVEGGHIRDGELGAVDIDAKTAELEIDGSCQCGSLADARRAYNMAQGLDRLYLGQYVRTLEACLPCKYCDESVDEVIKELGEASATSEDEAESTLVNDTSSSSGGASDITSSWRELEGEGSVEHDAMVEFVELEGHLLRSELAECRIDTLAIFEKGVSDITVNHMCTTRTKHNILEFYAGRCVRRYGPPLEGVGAIYDLSKDAIIPARCRGSLVSADVPNGYYYSCNRLKVWNGPELISGVNYALDYGRVSNLRGRYDVFVGVPGAGKTWKMIEDRVDVLKKNPNEVLFVSATKKSVLSARKYAVKFGVDKDVADARIMTIDSYLMHSKCRAKILCIDEYAMVHSGKLDAVASISYADDIFLFGDAKQIPYNPFCADFVCRHLSVRGTVDPSKVVFSGMTHRLSERGCAPWIDQYPAIYPCDCCRSEEKDRAQFRSVRLRNIAEVVVAPDTRVHAYTQDERDELKSSMGLVKSVNELKEIESGGLSTVHEDQGSTHDNVHTVRVHPDYDKNQSPKNPSLYNRVNYVLTDMTRTRYDYTYSTACAEEDEVIKRVEMANDLERIKIVREHGSLYQGTMADMV